MDLANELRKGIEAIRGQRIEQVWYGPFFDKWVRVMAYEHGKDGGQ